MCCNPLRRSFFHTITVNTSGCSSCLLFLWVALTLHELGAQSCRWFICLGDGIVPFTPADPHLGLNPIPIFSTVAGGKGRLNRSHVGAAGKYEAWGGATRVDILIVFDLLWETACWIVFSWIETVFMSFPLDSARICSPKTCCNEKCRLWVRCAIYVQYTIVYP